MEMGALARTDRGAAAMRSPIAWALLGLLIERAGYGYDLFERFGRTYGDSLGLSSPSQVYKALNVLEQRQLIEALPHEQVDRGTSREPSRPVAPAFLRVGSRCSTLKTRSRSSSASSRPALLTPATPPMIRCSEAASPSG
jgi:hypothetical protein